MGGGLISFLVQKSASKVLKTGYFAYSSGKWGGSSPRYPLAPLLRGCELHKLRNGGLQELQSCGLAVAD